MTWSMDVLATRRVRYADLVPCRNAFVDTRSPGSDRKENFTIIGPGVSESAGQHVHIAETHGFNVGGARQPYGCLNSQHSHEGAEVFVVHTGRWRLFFGPEREDGCLDIGPGDVASVPIHMFRGFEKLDAGTGFLWVVLGGDDPGRVRWAPKVFDLAREHGLILLKGGRLVDLAAGETLPDDAELEKAPEADEIAQLVTPSSDRLAQCLVRHQDLRPSASSPLAREGIEECSVIAPAAGADGIGPGPITGWWPHGFQLRVLRLAEGASTPRYYCEEPEVLFVQSGRARIVGEAGELDLVAGDTFTSPQGWEHFIISDADTELVVVRGGDAPAGPCLTA
ncbi:MULTISPECIES: cupin domain-containing protein [unclassified Cobetia]|uniref:cupin domain-containing protein n=1 Tax=unclassified Cobetia TaxID=2609414 RepID=UPI00178CC2C6|nr:MULTISPECIES: cupin domain-containing protein [unclassified Cobetia]MBE2170258.1 cupin domain-containing protein [Cobetia sp. 2AS1]MDH2446972.1 cupin domain-containing protein [Cobetia sp. 2AS]